MGNEKASEMQLSSKSNSLSLPFGQAVTMIN